MSATCSAAAALSRSSADCRRRITYADADQSSVDKTTDRLNSQPATNTEDQPKPHHLTGHCEGLGFSEQRMSYGDNGCSEKLGRRRPPGEEGPGPEDGS